MTELDREIAAQEKRRQQLEDIVMSGPATQKGMDANKAFNLATERLQQLRNQRIRILSGAPEEAKAAAPAVEVRNPGRMEKAGPEAPPSKTDLSKPPGLTPEQRARTLRMSDVDWIMQVVGQAVREALDAAVIPVEARVAALEAGHSLPAKKRLDTDLIIKSAIDRKSRDLLSRIVALEQAPSTKYRGVWEAGGRYSVGDFVTMGGLWHCNRLTSAKPGTNSDWQLAVKSPR